MCTNENNKRFETEMRQIEMLHKFHISQLSSFEVVLKTLQVRAKKTLVIIKLSLVEVELKF